MVGHLYKQIVSATKWSTLAELLSKLIMPVSTIILARLLTPEDFGILVTTTMIISFAELFADAGFHKFLIQCQFSSNDDKYKFSTVAFWTNMSWSLLIWGGICFFSREISYLVGCPHKEKVIAISCVCIPIISYSSIYTALLKKELNFKALFYVRIVGVLVPLFVTIPLAVITRSYWALIIGMISLNLVTAIVLSIKSSWKPTIFFELKRLKQMFTFSVWSMIESISIWLTGYIDMFVVGSFLNQYFLGIYRTSMTTVGQIMTIVTAATTPVLYSSLSQLQNDRSEFKKLFFKFQKIIGMFVFPLGFGIYLFRTLIVKVLLGEQWCDAIYFIGIWGVSSSITIVLAHYSSEVYRSIGKPKLSVIVQILHILVLLPVILYFVKSDFVILCSARALVRMQLVMVNLIFMYYVVKISPLTMIKNIFPSFICSVMMCLVINCLPKSMMLINNFIYVVFAILIYFVLILSFSEERRVIISLVKNGLSILQRKTEK